MLRDLQIDRVTYANINLWATLLGAAICLPIGQLFDRVGLRGATVALVLLLGGVVWSMSHFVVCALTLFALVLATRALGQSALSVASITAVGKSFDRRVGVAMGVYSVLLSVFFAAAFIAVGTSVRVNGWRPLGAGRVRPAVLCRARHAPAAGAVRADSRRRRRHERARAVLGGGAPHSGVLGVWRRDLVFWAGVVGAGTLQRGRPRRTRV